MEITHSIRRDISPVFLKTEPFFLFAVSFGVGIGIGPFIFHRSAFLPLLNLAFLLFLSSRIGKRDFLFCSAIAFIFLGCLFGVHKDRIPEQDISLLAAEGPMVLEGSVVTTPEIKQKGKKEIVSFALKVHSFFQNDEVRTASGKVQIFLYQPGMDIYCGDQIRIRGTLKTPKQNRNPHAFQYGTHLAKQGIYVIFQGIGKKAIYRREFRPRHFLWAWIQNTRIILSKRLDVLLPRPEVSLAKALLLGLRKEIPREVMDDYVKTGTAHLISISGLHVALIGQFIYGLGRLFRMGRPLNLIMTMIGIGFYTLLAGCDPPVLRSALMGTLFLLSFLIGENGRYGNLLFLAFLVLLAVNPSFLSQVSFQLSFLAMFSLIYLKSRFLLVPEKRKQTETWQDGIKRSTLNLMSEFMAITIGMLPVLIWYFHLFSPVGFLANLLAIPLSMLGIIFSFLLLISDFCIPWLVPVFQVLSALFFKMCSGWIHLWAQNPYGYFYFPRFPVALLFVYYAVLLFWFWSPKFKNKKRQYVVALLTAFFFLISCKAFAAHFSFKATFFDLGKNDACFFSFSDRSAHLIHAGRSFPQDQAYWVLRAFLLGSGRRKLDSLIVSRWDHEHAGGLQVLSKDFYFQNLFTPDPHSNRNAFRKYASSIDQRKILPSRGFFSFQKKQSIQFNSDAQGVISSMLIKEGKYQLLYFSSVKETAFRLFLHDKETKVDLLFLPHHEFGLHKTEQEFLKKIKVKLIVFNQRGPEAAVLKEKIASLTGATVLSIEEWGALEVSLHSSGPTWKTYDKIGQTELNLLFSSTSKR